MVRRLTQSTYESIRENNSPSRRALDRPLYQAAHSPGNHRGTYVVRHSGFSWKVYSPLTRQFSISSGRQPGTIVQEAILGSITNMVNAQVDPVLAHIRRLACRATADCRSDSELLREFAARRDEAAFTEL